MENCFERARLQPRRKCNQIRHGESRTKTTLGSRVFSFPFVFAALPVMTLLYSHSRADDVFHMEYIGALVP
jgi:hypothetical protein